ncbi:SDR family NAD(P)-dependent oxidoreductase [Geodermatophilus sp. DSM 44513]|uniref:SDR family NAD(P)-dependent oxidoreductase n=1 Tax=Geodermatophilus sp. DSM 44513 TaxID=1528104 RepID=UPI00126DBF64|nr:SDR family NAD(P)-dependent oxidoreductase [Geodermatophilus sp. DSM 44513]WNV75183.1 SDR family NAD(P)-dependent oxidoreductase [Geodermatophilus sp. DSM 44513]
MRTRFITGASRGFGREVTEQLLARGNRVAATLRRSEQLADLTAVHGDRLRVRRLDVTDTAQLRAVVDAAFAELGRVDVVVSNVGYGVFGAAEELTDDDQIDALLATNLTAAIQLARTVVPHLRAQGGGRILQVSSMGAHLGFPTFSLYHATQWGIERFYEAFAPEVEPFGIRTTLVEPGMIRTSFYYAAERTPVHPAYADHPGDGPRHDPGREHARRPEQGRRSHDQRCGGRRPAATAAARIGRLPARARRPHRPTRCLRGAARGGAVHRR